MSRGVIQLYCKLFLYKLSKNIGLETFVWKPAIHDQFSSNETPAIVPATWMLSFDWLTGRPYEFSHQVEAFVVEGPAGENEGFLWHPIRRSMRRRLSSYS